MDSQLQITLLGEFNVVVPGRSAFIFNGDRPISLLAYLLLHRHTPVSRQTLAYTLWPDSSDSQARTNLRNLLFTLRQTLPEADRYVSVTPQTLQWRPESEFGLDVADFEAALGLARASPDPGEKIQALEAAVALFKGDLLPGIYDDWIITWRESLRQDYNEALHQLAALLEQTGDYRAAARASQRLIQEDPLDEAAYVHLMRLYALIGDRARVHRIYEQCTAVLRREIDVEPAAATQEAYAYFMKMEPASSPSATPSPVVSPRPRKTLANVPQINTLFVGREQEMAEIVSLLSGMITPLLTIVGPGGAGKSRLAMRVATELAATFTEGAVFVPLAAVVYADGVPTALAGALGVSLSGSVSPEDEIIEYLLDRDILIILDNFEHLLEASDFVVRLTQNAPGVRLLATSRERLRVQAEWVFKLGGLAVPPADGSGDIKSFEAVRLFIEAARRAGNDFTLTPHNQMAVAQICRLLDGLPLAIELAAAQVSFLPPDVLLQRLDRALPLLVDGARDLPLRQRTIRATIEWSTALLSDNERLLFTRLAIFVGGFTLTVAETVCADEQLTSSEVLPLLRRLIEHSLLVQETCGDEMRYRFLEPIRQFAVEELALNGQAAAQAQRHALYFTQLAAAIAPRLQSPEQVEGLEQLAREFPNLRAAFRWFLKEGDLEKATSLCWDLWTFLWLRGHLSVGRRWVEELLPLTEEAPSSTRGRALLAAMVIGFGQGNHVWAAAFIDECFAIYDALDEPVNLAHATSLAGLITAGLQNFADAEPLMELGVERYLAVDSTWNAAMLLTYWSAIPRLLGEYARAKKITIRALELAQQQGDKVTMYSSLFNLASIAQGENDPHEALRYFRQALALAAEVRDIGNILPCLKGIAEGAVALGDMRYAVSLWGAAEAIFEASEAAVYTYAPDAAQDAAVIAKARSHLPDDEWIALWNEGRTLSLKDALQRALNFDPIAAD